MCKFSPGKIKKNSSFYSDFFHLTGSWARSLFFSYSFYLCCFVLQLFFLFMLFCSSVILFIYVVLFSIFYLDYFFQCWISCFFHVLCASLMFFYFLVFSVFHQHYTIEPLLRVTSLVSSIVSNLYVSLCK